MEARHIELQRFSKKADGYKAALAREPYARSLELFATAAVLLGHFRKQDRSPDDVRIVDLMAGSGYLGNFLRTVGFHRTWALEASPEMASGTPAVGGPKRVGFTHWSEVGDRLAEIEPDAVVAMAGFHHLIQHEGKVIDRAASLVCQFEVAHECVQRLDSNGILLIVDLVEPGIANGANLASVNAWDGEVFMKADGLPEGLREALAATKSFEEYCATVRSVSSRLGTNPTLRWFREVVDRRTKIGHDDVAVSRELVHLLRSCHSVEFTAFDCPWIFRSRGEAAHYAFDKFGFGLDTPWTEVDGRALLQDAARTVGIVEEQDRIFIGWNLGALLVRGSGVVQDPHWPFANCAIVAVVLCLAIRLILTMLGADDGLIEFVDRLAFLSAGIGAPELLKAVRARWGSDQ